MKIKKTLLMIMCIVLCQIFGYYIGRNIGQMTTPFGIIEISLSFVFFVIIYIFLIVTHELIHAVFFKKGELGLRALVLFHFIFISQDGKFKIIYNPTLMFSFGGMAIPSLPLIKNEEDFKNAQKSYSKAIVAAPLATIIIGVIICAISLTIKFINISEIISIFSSIIIAETLLIVIVLQLSCLRRNEFVIGDYQCAKLSKSDEFFIANMMYDYVKFSENGVEKYKSSDFLRGKIYDGLLNQYQYQYQNKKVDIFIVFAITNAITDFISGVTKTIHPVVFDYITFFSENPEKYYESSAVEPYRILLFRIIILLSQKEETREKAKSLFIKAKQNTLKNQVINYHITQCEQALGISNNSESLLNKNNIKPSSEYKVFKHFDGFNHFENAINERITRY